MIRKYVFLPSLMMLALTIGIAGCKDNPTPTPSAKEAKQSGKKDEDHGHKPGSHNGSIVAIGQDSYHAEAVFEKDGVIRLYTLGKDEAKLLEVDAEPLQAFVKADGDTEAEAIVLRPEPQAGDPMGKTS